MLLHSLRRNTEGRRDPLRGSGCALATHRGKYASKRTESQGDWGERDEEGEGGHLRPSSLTFVCAYARWYLYIELNIRYIIHFKFFLLACPGNVRITRTLRDRAHKRTLSPFFSLALSLLPALFPCLSRNRSRTRVYVRFRGSVYIVYVYTLRRVRSKLTSASALL